MPKKTTRHGYLADGLSALKKWRGKPEGDPASDLNKTNWRISPIEAEPSEAKFLQMEKRQAIRPTLAQIEKSVKGAFFKESPTGPYPIGGDIEYGTYLDENGLSHKIVVRIGDIRFSDGTQTEKTLKYGADGKVIEYDALLPIGAIIGASERQERLLGGDEKVSNANYTEVYGARHSNVKRKKRTQCGRPLTKEEMARVSHSVEKDGCKITKCPKGFPWKPKNLRDLFLGLEIGCNGGTTITSWEDILSATIRREMWVEAEKALSRSDTNTLDVALVAKNMSEISPGGSNRGAQKRGKRALQAANDNLDAALKRAS